MKQKTVFENRTDDQFRTFRGGVCGAIRAQKAGGDKMVLETDKRIELKLVGKLGGSGFDCTSRVYSPDGLCPTIVTCQGGSQEPKILDEIRIRRLTPTECGRLMGVDNEDIKKMKKVNSDNQLYKQFGNSIVVDVMCEMFKNLNIAISKEAEDGQEER